MAAGARTIVPSLRLSDGEPVVAPGDLRLEQVAHAQEARDEVGRRPLVEILGGPELLDPAAMNDGDAVGHRHRLFLVVGHEDERDADLVLDALELHLHLLAQLQVERAERLVEQEDLRVVHEGSRQRDALLLATGELARLAILVAGQLHQLEHGPDLLAHLGVGQLAPAQPERDVVEDREVREERVVLEDGVRRALVGRDVGDVGVAQVDGAGGDGLEAADHPQRRGLPAAGGSEHREELSGLDLQVQIVDRDEVVKTLRHRFNPNVSLGHAHHSTLSRCSRLAEYRIGRSSPVKKFAVARISFDHPADAGALQVSVRALSTMASTTARDRAPSSRVG